MDIKQIKENKIRMILQFSIPSIIAMLLQTVITITDGYFTGNYVGQNALAAINLGLPILYFYLGTGLCIGVGGSVISGRMLGSNERKKSSEVFSQTVVAALITCVAISVIVFLLFTPILKYYTEKGFDPTKHILQSYGTGWQSANFLDQERQLFGAPGGIITDWNLMTNVEGIYAAGDQLYASDCCGYACATGYYAGRKAADACDNKEIVDYDILDVEAEKKRLYAPLYVENGMHWKELNAAIAKCMQNYCGGIKCEDLLQEGLSLLNTYENEMVPQLSCTNPHDLMRTHEVLDILQVAKMIMQACLFRKSSSDELHFYRSDYPEKDPEQDRCFITIRQENGKAVRGEIPLDYYGDIQTEYEKRNQDYIKEVAHGV